MKSLFLTEPQVNFSLLGDLGFLSFPLASYSEMAKDFEYATHLKAIEDINFDEDEIIYIACKCVDTLLIAMSYVFAKELEHLGYKFVGDVMQGSCNFQLQDILKDTLKLEYLSKFVQANLTDTSCLPTAKDSYTSPFLLNIDSVSSDALTRFVLEYKAKSAMVIATTEYSEEQLIQLRKLYRVRQIRIENISMTYYKAVIKSVIYSSGKSLAENINFEDIINKIFFCFEKRSSSLRSCAAVAINNSGASEVVNMSDFMSFLQPIFNFNVKANLLNAYSKSGAEFATRKEINELFLIEATFAKKNLKVSNVMNELEQCRNMRIQLLGNDSEIVMEDIVKTREKLLIR